MNLRRYPPVFVDFLLTAQLTHETLPLQLPRGQAGQVRAVWAVKVKVWVWVWVWAVKVWSRRSGLRSEG